MRVALISDTHANLAALEAVLAAAHEAGADSVWCMGDLVGYGAEPDAVVARLREARASCVLGNHDAAAIGRLSVEDFNPAAAAAARWTAKAMAPETRSYLDELPLVQRDDLAERCHGTLADPIWEYLASTSAARRHFALQRATFSFVGHTHLPMVTWPEGDAFRAVRPGDGESVELGDAPVCINPGGVGQPRDGDPRASWALFEIGERRVTFHRVPYDFETTQRLIRGAGLPDSLAARLALGR